MNESDKVVVRYLLIFSLYVDLRTCRNNVYLAEFR